MIPIARWVSPFRYPRINACSRLPMAFRSVPRLSSPPDAKASTKCPSHTHMLHIHSNHPHVSRAASLRRENAASAYLSIIPIFLLTLCMLNVSSLIASKPPHNTNVRHQHHAKASPRVRPTRKPTAHRKCTNLFTLTKIKHRSHRKISRAANLKTLFITMLSPQKWWRRTGSNRQPPACKAGALPTELRPPKPSPDLSTRK